MKGEKIRADRLYHIFYVVIVSVIVAIVVVLILTATAEERHPIKVGCILSGSIREAGWNSENYEGLKAACDNAGLGLAVRDNVPDEEMACISATSALASEGCEVIFLASYGYQQYADKLMSFYPEVRFCVTGSEHEDDSLIYCSARLYEGRYLAGLIAGSTTQSDIVGYVAAAPDNEVNRSINAFALGVRKVDPDARVKVIFTGSADDSEKEKSAVSSLVGASADVIAYHQDQESVPEACAAIGADFIGSCEMPADRSAYCLTSIDCNWEKIYTNILRDLKKRGRIKNNIYWLGVSDNAVGLTEYSEKVSLRARYEVSFAEEKIDAGINVFSGGIYDNAGTLRCAEGEALADKSLMFGMDWYVQGVEIYEDQ